MEIKLNNFKRTYNFLFENSENETKSEYILNPANGILTRAILPTPEQIGIKYGYEKDNEGRIKLKDTYTDVNIKTDYVPFKFIATDETNPAEYKGKIIAHYLKSLEGLPSKLNILKIYRHKNNNNENLVFDGTVKAVKELHTDLPLKDMPKCEELYYRGNSFTDMLPTKTMYINSISEYNINELQNINKINTLIINGSIYDFKLPDNKIENIIIENVSYKEKYSGIEIKSIKLPKGLKSIKIKPETSKCKEFVINDELEIFELYTKNTAIKFVNAFNVKKMNIYLESKNAYIYVNTLPIHNIYLANYTSNNFFIDIFKDSKNKMLKQYGSTIDLMDPETYYTLMYINNPNIRSYMLMNIDESKFDELLIKY